MGKLVSSTPMASILSWNHLRIQFQVNMAAAARSVKSAWCAHENSGMPSHVEECRNPRSSITFSQSASARSFSVCKPVAYLVVFNHLALHDQFLVPLAEVGVFGDSDTNDLLGIILLSSDHWNLLAALLLGALGSLSSPLHGKIRSQTTD